MLRRSVRLQRVVASALAVALCCFITLTQAGDCRPLHGTKQFKRATVGPDQCLLACNGSSNVAPAAPFLKTRFTTIPRAHLAVITSPQTRDIASSDLIRAAVLRVPRMVGTVELRL